MSEERNGLIFVNCEENKDWPKFVGKEDTVFKVLKNGVPKEREKEIKKEIQEFIIRVSKALEKAPKIIPDAPLTMVLLYFMMGHNINHKTKIFIHQEEPNEFVIGVMPEEEFEKIMTGLIKEMAPRLLIDYITNFITQFEQ